MYRPRFNKFSARRMDGFHSGGERDYHKLLLLREKAGEIENIRCQTQIELSLAQIVYKPDFVVFDKALGEDVIHEFKGYETKEWRIKRKLYQVYGPKKMEVWNQDRGRFFKKEDILPREPKIICCHCGQPALKGGA